MKSSNLTTMKVRFPGNCDFLPSSLSSNENMIEAEFSDIPPPSLIAIAVAIEKWPSLRKLTVIIDKPDCTTDEEASAFLSAVGRHSSLRSVRICMDVEVEESHPYYRLILKKSYPSTVDLQHPFGFFLCQFIPA